MLINDLDPDASDKGLLEVVPGSAKSFYGADVTFAADGSYTFNPAVSPILAGLEKHESLVDTVTYTVRDPQGETSIGTYSI